MAKSEITEAEWPIMVVLWEKESATAAEIVEAVTRKRAVSMRTIKTLIRRLITKKAVGFRPDDKERIYHYRALLSREEVTQTKNLGFLRMVYDDNPMDLLAQFVNDSPLTESQIAELRTLLDRKTPEAPDHE